MAIQVVETALLVFFFLSTLELDSHNSVSSFIRKYHLGHSSVYQIKSKSLLMSHHHSTCSLVSEILESVLQTVQKKITYRQYILTDLCRRQCAEYIYSVHIVYFLRHTYSYQYTLYTVCTQCIMYTYKQYANVQQILHRPDTQCHGCALHGIQW